LVKDQRKVLHKIKLITPNNDEVMVDLDEMELEAYYQSIDQFISVYYKSMLKIEDLVVKG
jgi:hypothetical protein